MAKIGEKSSSFLERHRDTHAVPVANLLAHYYLLSVMLKVKWPNANELKGQKWPPIMAKTRQFQQ